MTREPDVTADALDADLRRRLALPGNPFALIAKPLAWRSVGYCLTSALVGLAALVAGVVGFAALGFVSRRIARVEGRRVTVLRLPRLDAPAPTGSTVAVWGATVLFGFVDTILGAAMLAGVAMLAWILIQAIGVTTVSAAPGLLAPRLLAVIVESLLLWGLVTFALYVAWGLASAQARAVHRLLASQANLSRRVAELTSSRTELVDTFETERRRIERDLHDGAQQHLVVATMRLGEARYWLDETKPDDTRACVLAAQQSIEDALAALRTTIRGLHPQVLTERGLVAAVRELAARHPIPTTFATRGEPRPLAASVENAAYHLVSEALTNVAKHARASSATVTLDYTDALVAAVTDDGAGGARCVGGHGLSGLTERMAAVGGALTITSPAGGPTQIVARFDPGGAPSES